MSQGDLKFSDWPMFDRVMRDPDVCRRFLQVVLGIEVGRLDYVDVEKSLFPDIEAKSVRLDVFAKDSSHVFDVEMQSLPERRLGRRLRYYQAAMDVTSMPAGVAYDGLPESYIIFLCGHDPFGRGVPVYTFKMSCPEDSSTDLKCGFAWIVLNAEAWGCCENPALKSLLKYTSKGSVEDDALVEAIDGLVKEANQNREWRKNAMGVMTLEHHMRAHISMARKEGLAKGHAEGLAEGFAEGKEQEDKRFSRLIDALFEADRVEDLRRVANDDAYRDKLFQEFGIA